MEKTLNGFPQPTRLFQILRDLILNALIAPTLLTFVLMVGVGVIMEIRALQVHTIQKQIRWAIIMYIGLMLQVLIVIAVFQ